MQVYYALALAKQFKLLQELWSQLKSAENQLLGAAQAGEAYLID